MLFTFCINYSSVAGIKHYGQASLYKEEFIGAYSSRERRAYHGRKAWWPEQETKKPLGFVGGLFLFLFF